MNSDKRVTISDIANEVGVSTTTVSRFLGGHYQSMSKSTREKIRIAVQKHGYRPSLVARGLKSSKSYLIGVIMPQVHKTVSSHSLRGVCLACTNSPYSPIIVSIENNTETERAKVQELIDHRVDGILTFTGSGDQYYEKAIADGVPVVRVDRVDGCRPIDGVCINHYEAVQDVLLNLSVSGFTKIAIFTNHTSLSPYSTIITRRRAYFDFISKSSYPTPVEYTIDAASNDSIESAVRRFLAEYPDEKKAIFVLSVESLPTVDWVCKLMGLSYPEDIALVGYVLEDDTAASASELSVVSQPITRMCQEALSLISARISDDESSPDPIVRTIPASIIIRKSTII